MATQGRAWPLPGEPLPVRLMNTIRADSHGVHDDLATPGDLEAWLAGAAGFPPTGRITHEDHEEARRLRDALRRLAAFRTGDGRPAAASPLAGPGDAVSVVNALAATLPPEQLVLRQSQVVRAVPAGPSVRLALATIAASAVAFFAGPEADRLRTCEAPGCVLYFVQTHPRRQWCSAACGNRARVARHARRLRAQSGSQKTA